MTVTTFPELPQQRYFSDLSKKGLLQLAQFNLSHASAETCTLQACLPEDQTHRLTYAHPLGDESLRAALLEFLDFQWQPQIMLFSGAQEAIFSMMATTLQSKDQVIILSPSYMPLFKAPDIFGAEAVPIALTEAQEWQLDLNQLEAALSSRTKMIIINHPHNPTGACLSQEAIHYLHQLVEKRDIYLVCDEVSLQSDFQSQGITSLMNQHPKVVSIGVCSKSLGLSGLRVGWLACNDPNLIQQLSTIKSYLSICTSRADELLLIQALKNSPSILTRNNRIIANNYHLFSDMVAHLPHSIRWVPPTAGLLGVAYIQTTQPIEHFTETLLKATGLLLLPGTCFNLPSAYVRIGLGQEAFPDYLPKFSAYLADL